jgi:hypothetical protein
VTHPEGLPAVKVGVLLPGQPDDLGDWLADGAAFEAAGAHALWVDLVPDSPLDPLALTAALAAVTFRSLLVTALPATALPASAGPSAARTVATVTRLSRGRLSVVVDDRTGDLTGFDLNAGTFRRVAAAPRDATQVAAGDASQVAPGDATHVAEVATKVASEAFEHTATGERWVSGATPDSRATWRATLLDAAERGAAGLVVPAGPRLLDILRNPDDTGHRRDLQLAQG